MKEVIVQEISCFSQHTFSIKLHSLNDKTAIKDRNLNTAIIKIIPKQRPPRF